MQERNDEEFLKVGLHKDDALCMVLLWNITCGILTYFVVCAIMVKV